MKESEIEWTTHTFNPWWGCTKVSPGCLNCYAEALANRFSGDIWGKGKPRRTFGDKHWAQPLKWNADAKCAGRRAKVFCASMADVFDPEAPEAERQKLWRLIEQTPWLDWQLLTKRPELISDCLPEAWLQQARPNVWIGASVEDRKRMSRIDVLRTVPAVVRFLSIEPLIEDLGEIDLAGIDWCIIGGESGPGARPMRSEWVLALRDQCFAARVPFFFKQWGTLKNNPDVDDPTAKENGGTSKGGRASVDRCGTNFPSLLLRWIASLLWLRTLSHQNPA